VRPKRRVKQLSNGKIMPAPKEYKPGTPEFGERARRRGGRSAEEIYREKKSGVVPALRERKREINKILEVD
jgi:hypothetical protein